MSTASIYRGLGNGRVLRYHGVDPVLLARLAREARGAVERIASVAAVMLAGDELARSGIEKAVRDVGVCTDRVHDWAWTITGSDLENHPPRVTGPEARGLVYFAAVRSAMPKGEVRALTPEELALLYEDQLAADRVVARVVALIETGRVERLSSGPWHSVACHLDTARRALLAAILPQIPPTTPLGNLIATADARLVAAMRSVTPDDVGSPSHPVGRHLSCVGYVVPGVWQV